MNVLIVEDEQQLAEEMAAYLSKEGFLCEVALTGASASEQIAVNRYDFVLLDLGLPDYEGLDLIAEIRVGNADAALLITTARGAVEDKVKGLDLGADDYLPKPFALMELLSRMKAVARRKFGTASSLLQAGSFTLDLNARTLLHKDQPVTLTKKQFDLLEYLVLNKNKALSRIQLYEHIWGNMLDDQYDSNFIDVHIKNLRKKLKEYDQVDWLTTVRGVGYKADLE
ncbi:response regulator transcription factor [Geofilum rhodophaeum]|uniref:response regulator transcription factor n=1 Tax=Geofilum rhodophaeum TaxID=1965019 RepID=UPI000B51ECBF|nr:response regulator transcription factor [Geofilum rhodophaeum]